MNWDALRIRNPRFLIAAVVVVASVIAMNTNWSFLHSVSNRDLTQAAQREFAAHWSVMNTGKPLRPFPYSTQAAEFEQLSQQAVTWYKELKAKGKGKPLDQHPNVLWTIEVADAVREDSISEPRMTMTVRVYATDCYKKVVTQENCVGYPSFVTEERVALHFGEVDGEWRVTNYQLLAEYLFKNDDRLFWLCLRDGDESDCPVAPIR